MIFLPSFSNVSIANRGGRWNGDRAGWGGVGRGKTTRLGTP